MMTQLRTNPLGYGVVDKSIAPNRPGRIRFRGTYWKAELAYPGCRKIAAGETAKVIGIQGIGLLVTPEDDELLG